MKAHQIISSHLKLFIENLHQKKYLNEQIKPLHPVLHVVRYHKLVIVWYNAFDNAKFIEQGTGAYHYGVLEINLFLERVIILNAIFF